MNFRDIFKRKELVGAGARRGLFALVDQSLIAGTNFVTALLLARLAPLDEYGAYALMFSVLTFVIGLQGALVTGPMMIFVVSRAGLLTLLTSVTVCLLLFRRGNGVWRFVLIGTCIVVLALAFDIDIGLARADRAINVTQIFDNLLSTFTTETHTGLNVTKEWRLNWWSEIIHYTVFGPYFLLGKGFGINLATSDGFQVAADQSLRSPHSIHFAILARAGVPGLLIWIGLQASWGLTLLRACLRARRMGETTWVAFFTFLIAYWVAFLVNASFDVYLEGPMGGIWFWTLFGVGLAATQIFYTAPEVLDGLDLHENSHPA